jgi:antitoxin FitA
VNRRKESQLVVRKLDPRVVDALRTRAARHGRSMEAEHREILRAALRPAPDRTSLKEWLRRMPNVGTDRDFTRDRRRPRRPRPVRL